MAAPPVPVERLIQLRGARLAVRSLEDSVSGFVYRDEGQPVIGINDSIPACAAAVYNGTRAGGI